MHISAQLASRTANRYDGRPNGRQTLRLSELIARTIACNQVSNTAYKPVGRWDCPSDAAVMLSSDQRERSTNPREPPFPFLPVPPAGAEGGQPADAAMPLPLSQTGQFHPPQNFGVKLSRNKQRAGAKRPTTRRRIGGRHDGRMPACRSPVADRISGREGGEAGRGSDGSEADPGSTRRRSRDACGVHTAVKANYRSVTGVSDSRTGRSMLYSAPDSTYAENVP